MYTNMFRITNWFDLAMPVCLSVRLYVSMSTSLSVFEIFQLEWNTTAHKYMTDLFRFEVMGNTMTITYSSDTTDISYIRL